MREKTWSRHSNFRWCIDNDFQVYIKPDKIYEESRTCSKEYRICIRSGGITTCGKDRFEINSVYYTSKESIGTILYKTQQEAEAALPGIYKKLRETYG